MEALYSLSDSKQVALVCAVSSVLLVCFLAVNVITRYERSFLKWAATSLQHSFIAADPKLLFTGSIVLTLLAGTCTYFALGAPPTVIAVVLCLAGPRLLIKSIAKRRAKRILHQLPDALLSLASALRAGSKLEPWPRASGGSSTCTTGSGIHRGCG